MSEIIELYKKYKNEFERLDLPYAHPSIYAESLLTTSYNLDIYSDQIDKYSINILQNYLNKFEISKHEQLEKSKQEYINIKNITPNTNIILFNNIIDDFDKYINSYEYIQQINICINIIKKIGSEFDPSTLKCDKYSFAYSFFKNNIQQQSYFNTLLKAMYTLGCNKYILSLEFKKFFSCGHRPVSLITDNILNITYNVDTYEEFFKKCINIENSCKTKNIMYLYEEFKNNFIILKKIVIKNIILKLIECSKEKIKLCSKEKININLCLQECDYDLFEYLKNELTIFNSHIYSPQNNISYKIDDYTDFCTTLDINKIINNDSVKKFGFVTFSTFGIKNQILKSVNVFNSFVLNHEKDSKIRGLTLSSRGIFVPELNIYNLHLKKDQACSNLYSLEKYYFNKEYNLENHKKIYEFSYDFTNSNTQLYYYSLLKEVYTNFSERFYQLIIDIYYDKKITIFERYNKLDYNELNKFDITSYINVINLDKFKEINKTIFETINYDKFIKAVNYQYIYDTEKWITKELIQNIKDNYTLDSNLNPDNIIKEFCKNKFNINAINESYTILSDKLIIMGDLNIILCENCIDNQIVRIKKSSYNSSQDENEPFNIFLNMNLSSNGNDAIFSFI